MEYEGRRVVARQTDWLIGAKRKVCTQSSIAWFALVSPISRPIRFHSICGASFNFKECNTYALTDDHRLLPTPIRHPSERHTPALYDGPRAGLWTARGDWGERV
ncbi:hypothetical protein FA13DRAFT_1741205 [Coprinellus micaceus]|uniref:Uncharacterized protein n=1 Tax=Coprinellus micaceus TaxID=71717 RepID=A0A4Y7SJT1_COPMI|nr:hypothetical protein FA13DRAFT_1741205 [Coprinellus micaceus]